MTDRAIPELEAATELVDSDQLLIWSKAKTQRVSLSQIADFITPANTGGGTALRYCTVRRSVYQMVSSYPVYVAWQLIEASTEPMWDTSQPTRLTPPADATVVRLTANIGPQQVTSSGSLNLAIHKNGAAAHGLPSTNIRHYNTGSPRADLNIASAPIPVTPGDYFELSYDIRNIVYKTIMAVPETWFSMEVLSTT